MIVYADDMAIHGGPIGEDILYEQMTTALKKIETKAMQLGLKFGRQRKYFEEYLHSNYTINTGVRSSYILNGGPYRYRQVTSLPESRDASYSGGTTRHKCQSDETRTSDGTSGTQSKAK